MCNSISSHTTSGLFNTALTQHTLFCRVKNLNYDLVEECKRSSEGSALTETMQHTLESLPREIRREVVRKVRNGCAPLFVACKRGAVEIVDYLITICEADFEQRGHYEVPEDRSFHYVTPLWCAVVSGKLPVVKYLIRVGADINAPSDSGSTPVRSACFMSHFEIVQYLVENGADITRPNMNGGTCLINSVQSTQLCLYLIQKGADINAKDIQEKTALHYSIQEHRLETTKLLMEHGANPYAKSRYGDDALRTACLKGAHEIFEYLKYNWGFSVERMAEAHELIGSTFLDDHNETRVAILHWRLAHHIRLRITHYIEKTPKVPKRKAYANAVEFTTLEELDNIATDVDAMRMQSLLICERILGIQHKDMLFRLMFRGASYADALRFQRCIDLWRLTLEVRVKHFSILYSETCFTAQALVRLMIDLYERHKEAAPNESSDQNVPLFEDVFSVLQTLTENILEAQDLLQIRPIFRKQQENFDRVLKCIVHLIYLMIKTARTLEERTLTYTRVRELVFANIRSACTNDTFLHLCVSRLNVIKSGYFGQGAPLKIVFPNADVINLLIKCGSEINAKNEAKSTPLHVAALPYNYDDNIIMLLLENGADIDQPNRSDERPYNIILSNPVNNIPLMNFINLKCLSATVINKYQIPYQNQIPKALEKFVKDHEP